MKFKLLVTALALAMTQTVFAADYPANPRKCPTVASIKSVGVSDAYLLRDAEGGALTGIERHNYFGTKVEWTLLVGIFYPDTSKSEVLAKANTLISDLTYAVGPVQERNGLWVCAYKHPTDKDHSDKGYAAWAIYPAVDIPQSMLTGILKK